MDSTERTKYLSVIASQLRAALPAGEDAVWQAFIKAMSQALDCEAASFFSVNDARRLLTLKFALGPSAKEIANITFGYQGIVGAAAANRRSEISNDVSKDPDFCGKLDRATGFKTKAVLCAPIIHAGDLLGVIELINPRCGAFTETDRELADFLCIAVAKAVHDLRKATGTA